MRSTLACSWCRHSKVKCVHDGTAPCRACKRGSRESSCVLSEPKLKTRAGRSTKKHATLEEANVSPRTNGVAHRGQPISRFISTPTIEGLEGPAAETCNPVQMTSLPLLIAAGRILHRIPSVSFIHTPTFFQTLREGHFDQLKVCAMLAVCARFVPELVTQHGSTVQAGEFYADFVRKRLNAKVSQGPHIETIQCLLLIAMYEWGESSGFNAWMYVGMAIRMSQALRPYSDVETSDTSTSGEMAVIRQETWDRTIWTCYTMDRLFSCGKDRPTIFVSAEMQIPLPLSEADYAFGEVRERRKYMKNLGIETSSGMRTIEHHFTIVLQGVDIWATLSKWTADGGRKKYHGPDDCPWKTTSAWNKINLDLENWYDSMDERVRYSPAKMAAQMHGPYPEAFAYINILYYLCRIFLHREFIPLIPLRISKPTGPTRPPLFHSEAPAGWWESSAETLHHAADSVAEILTGLAKVNNSWMSPIVGFCAFSAALTHFHVAAFPHMNLGRSTNATEKGEICADYLKGFTKMYKIGEDWVSTLAETRHLFERVLSNKSKYVEKSISLADAVYEYGSIISTQTSPNDATPTWQETDDREITRSEPAIVPPQTTDAGQFANAVSDFSMQDFPETFDLDDEFWRINDSFPGQQYLTSLTMGSEPGTSGDGRGWS